MATKTTDLTAIVYRVTRGLVSTMGNPSYIFHTNEGEYRTQSNNGAAYALENHIAINTPMETVMTLTLTPAGRVTNWYTN
jgi:hypothetical protein